MFTPAHGLAGCPLTVIRAQEEKLSYYLEKPLYSVAEASKLINVGKTRFYQELAAGRIRAVKSGKRTLVPAEAITEWVASLPPVTPAGKGV